jgi:predicted nucleotide-binding protein (sugar kinase/HSP70/actin superfamily)
MAKVTFPYMGTSPIAVKWLLEGLGHEVIVPPKPSTATLNLGVKYSPEFACLPYKIVMGSYIQALRMGADTIITSGGVGPCRAGQYAPVHECILKDQGFDFKMIVFEPPRKSLSDLIQKVKWLNAAKLLIPQLLKLLRETWTKLIALDELEKCSHLVRPREVNHGETSRVYEETLDWIDKAGTVKEIRQAHVAGLERIRSIEQNPDIDPLKIGIVGEIYVVIDPTANLEIEETLGHLGAYVERSIFLTNWTRENTFLDVLRLTNTHSKQAARPYLPEMIGGHGQDSLGNTVLYAKRGFDGVVQLAPFTCIPEIVAKSILPRISKEHNIPVLSLSLDEQTGKAGIATRLEAFVDLIKRRRQQCMGA